MFQSVLLTEFPCEPDGLAALCLSLTRRNMRLSCQFFVPALVQDNRSLGPFQNMEVSSKVPLLCIAFTIVATAWWCISKYHKTESSSQNTPLPYQEQGKYRSEEAEAANSQLSTLEWEERFKLYKELYFKLQHLENHPDVISESKEVLLSFLSGAIQSAQAQKGTILAIEQFSPNALDIFTKRELDEVTIRWQQYLERRKWGQLRELFHGEEEAKQWLVRMAPTKFVDGAWLGHIHKIKTPFVYRSVTKDAWQVLSEELGDGDLDKNHVQVYKELLQKIGAHLPAGNSIEFTQHPDMDDIQIWQSAVIQLLISLFPQEFLPEILGFNMHFEILTFETIVAAKELRELNIDPYHFTLHITIDNADTGHATMAKEAVTKYLERIRSSEGDNAAQEAWRRVQAGFLLSKCVPLDLNVLGSASHCPYPPTQYEAKVLRIFESKAIASNRIHDNCRARFGGRKLGAWLEPEAFKQKEWQMEFLYQLSNTKPWIYKGDSSRSRLVQLMSWGGPMFGAFTHSEVDTIRAWIGSLEPKNSSVYWQYTGRLEALPNNHGNSRVHVDYPVFLPEAFDDKTSDPQPKDLSLPTPLDTLSFNMSPNPQLAKVLPLWFVHPCILESFISIPWQTTNKVGCAAVKFLRAQYGFGPETSEIAGMDEMRRGDSIDLIDIGMEMAASLGCPAPKSIADVLERWPSPFAERLLTLSVRPKKHCWLLLGLAQAFVQLHCAMASSSGLLSPQSRNALHNIAEREKESMAVLVEGGRETEPDHSEFVTGYTWARQEIELAFSKC